MTVRQLLPVALLLVTPFALSQQGPMSGPPPQPMMGHNDFHHHHEMRGANGDHGMWWTNPEVIARLGITPDQKKKMEDIFLQSRVQLIDLNASLEKEQLLLQPLMNASPVDQSKAAAQIDRIADTRAELEKTNAKMLLGIRCTLTPDQWTKLRSEHSDWRHHGRGPDGRQHGRMNGPGNMGHNQQMQSTPAPSN